MLKTTTSRDSRIMQDYAVQNQPTHRTKHQKMSLTHSKHSNISKLKLDLQ